MCDSGPEKKSVSGAADNLNKICMLVNSIVWMLIS